MNKNFDQGLLVKVSLALMLSGCVHATTIQSNKAESFIAPPKRLFVLTDIGTDFGAEFSMAFQRAFVAIVKECGTELVISTITPLELDDSVHEKRMNAFAPDMMLSIRRAGGTRGDTGLLHVIYDLRLSDSSSKKLVWRANTNFFRGAVIIPIAKRGEALAVDITNKMKDDNIFLTCGV